MKNRIHLMNVSTQWRDPDNATIRDMTEALDRNPVSVYFTEIFQANHADLRNVCEDYGYHLHIAGNDAIALRDRGTRLVTQGDALVNSRDPGKPPGGGHSQRHLIWHSFYFRHRLITVSGSHWVTGYEKKDERRAKHELMSRAIVNLAETSHRRGSLFFYSGDINQPDDRGSSVGYEILEQAGLRTCWDELGVWPSTHGQDEETIDIIGAYDPEGVLECRSARAWPKVTSDHNSVSAVYKLPPVR